MTQDIHDLSIWIKDKKAPNTPEFICQRVNNFMSSCHRGCVDGIYVADFN
jgi:hypothetical protein